MASVMDVTAETWESEVLKSDRPVIVDFWHEACVWCKRLDPIYREVADEYGNRLKFAKLNVLASEDNRRIAEKYGIMGTPTMIFFCNGRPIQGLVGYRPKEKFMKEIEEVIQTYRQCFDQSTPV